jgi:hypothetical protein
MRVHIKNTAPYGNVKRSDVISAADIYFAPMWRTAFGKSHCQVQNIKLRQHIVVQIFTIWPSAIQNEHCSMLICGRRNTHFIAANRSQIAARCGESPQAVIESHAA